MAVEVEAEDEDAFREFNKALGALGGAFPDIACCGWRCRGKGEITEEECGDVVCDGEERVRCGGGRRKCE